MISVRSNVSRQRSSFGAAYNSVLLVGAFTNGVVSTPTLDTKNVTHFPSMEQKAWDSNGAFTVPVDGLYFVRVVVWTEAVGTFGPSEIAAGRIEVDDVLVSRKKNVGLANAQNCEMTPTPAAILKLVAGQVVKFKGFQNSGGNLAYRGSGEVLNKLVVVRIG